MGVLLQISDPHFGTDQPAVASALLALSRRERPTVAVWSGDITQRARPSQFHAARRFADDMAAHHLLAIPGNHDLPLWNLPLRLWRPYRSFQRVFGSALEPALSLPGLCLIGVNSTRPWRHKHGQVSAAQVRAVAEQLRASADAALRVVVVHHPLWVTEDSDRRNLLRGHDAALPAWWAAGADVILGGHIHLPYVRRLWEAAPEGAVAPLWIVQAGTALSRRVRGGIPNSVQLLRYDAAAPRQGRIERWDFHGPSASFRLVEAQVIG